DRPAADRGGADVRRAAHLAADRLGPPHRPRPGRLPRRRRRRPRGRPRPAARRVDRRAGRVGAPRQARPARGAHRRARRPGPAAVPAAGAGPVTAAEPPAGAQERPQAAVQAAAHAPHAPGVSQAATGPLSASPPKENPMTRHTPDEPQDVVTALVDKARELGVRLGDYEAKVLAAHVAAAARPEIEWQLRQQIARDIEETADADVIGPYEAGLDRAARVARGERLPGAPAPTLDDLVRRAAGIALPSEPADFLAALLRIGGDLARAYESARRADMERELGNLVVSSLRWMVRYGLDPRRCIETAERAQRAYAEREGRHGCPRRPGVAAPGPLRRPRDHPARPRPRRHRR